MSVTQVITHPPILYLRPDPIERQIQDLLNDMRRHGVRGEELTEWEETFAARRPGDETNFLLAVLITELIDPLIAEDPVVWPEFREKIIGLFQDLPVGMDAESWLEKCADEVDLAKVQKIRAASLEDSIPAMQKIAAKVHDQAHLAFESFRARGLSLINEQSDAKTKANKTAEKIEAVQINTDDLEALSKEIGEIGKIFEDLARKNT